MLFWLLAKFPEGLQILGQMAVLPRTAVAAFIPTNPANVPIPTPPLCGSLFCTSLSWWIVLISYCVCNVLPQICSFQQYKLLTLESRGPKSVSRDQSQGVSRAGFYWSPRGSFISCSSTSRDHLHFIGSWPLPLSSSAASHSSLTLLPSYIFSL